MSTKRLKAGKNGIKPEDKPGVAGANEKDILINELRNRIEFLENALKSKTESIPGIDITGHKQAEEERHRLIHDLQERVKEQTALYGTAKIFQQQKPIEELLQELAEMLPQAWQYPCVATARITCGGREYHSSGFREGAWSQAARFTTIEGGEGMIEVFYTEEMSQEFEGPFLAEERSLIDSLAGMLRDNLDRRRAEAALRESEERFRQLADNSPISMAINDKGDNIIYLNKKFIEVFGYTLADIPDLGSWWHLAYPDPLYREDAIRRWENGVDEALRESKDIGPIDYVVTCKDGSVRYVEISGAPVGDRELVLLQDVTERKRINDVLRESEEKFRDLADNIPNLAWMADAEGWIFWYNRQWYDYTGTTLEEMQGWGWQKVHHPDYVKSVTEEWSTRIKEGKPYDNIFPLRSKDGNYRWFLTRVTPIRDEQGRIVRWFGTNTDITERKQMEESLKLSGFSLDHAREMIFWLKPDGHFAYVNESACQRYGYEKDELLALTIFDLNPNYTEGSWKARWQMLRNKDSFIYNTENRTKDGSVFPVEISASRIVYGDKELMFAFARDMTERRLADEAREQLLNQIEEQRARLQATLDAIPVGVWIADASGKMILINDSARAIWGGQAPAAESIEDYYLYKFWWAKTGERVKAEDTPLARAITYGETRKNTLIDIERFDGTRGTTLISGAPIRDPQGHILGGIVIVQDISDLKRTEEALKTAKQQAELYLDLMGHDINNMNMAAMGFLELAKELVEDEGRLDRANVDLLDSAIASILKSSTLIANVGKLQQGMSGEHRLQTYDLGHVIGEVCEQFNRSPDKYVHIACGAAEGIHVQANELLRDVFVNLVGNAIKHTTGAAFINIRMNREVKGGQRYCIVSIEDNGPGIPDDLKDKIFDRLHRGDTKAKGSGLGLYLVKTLVESYGGKVWVEDRVPRDHAKGSRFIVLLPVADE